MERFGGHSVSRPQWRCTMHCTARPNAPTDMRRQPILSIPHVLRDLVCSTKLGSVRDVTVDWESLARSKGGEAVDPKNNCASHAISPYLHVSMYPSRISGICPSSADA